MKSPWKVTKLYIFWQIYSGYSTSCAIGWCTVTGHYYCIWQHEPDPRYRCRGATSRHCSCWDCCETKKIFKKFGNDRWRARCSSCVATWAGTSCHGATCRRYKLFYVILCNFSFIDNICNVFCWSAVAGAAPPWAIQLQQGFAALQQGFAALQQNFALQQQGLVALQQASAVECTWLFQIL